MKIRIKLKESDFLKQMNSFGLSKNDIDSEGYIILYHGAVHLPKILKKGEILFLTPSESEALDYAKMRSHETGKKGFVSRLRVKPTDVNWNQGSYEVEFSKGGKIINNTIYPLAQKIKPKINKKAMPYKGISVGQILPKTKWKVMNITIHSDNSAQLLLRTDTNKLLWYDADSVIQYEFN